MRLILTRPVADSLALAKSLSSLGHQTRILPLLAIVPRTSVQLPSYSYQAICLSSANGLQTDQLQHLLNTPLFCVGPQSAAAARNAGFTEVEAHGGDVVGLVAAIAARLLPDNGPLLYLSGAATSGDLEGKLSALGFTVDRIVTYDAVPQSPAELCQAIFWAEGVMLYSPRTAKLWADAVAAQLCSAETLLHICLSSNVASALPQSWRKRIARTADESAMMASLDRAGKDE